MSVPRFKRRPSGLDYVDNATNWKYYIKKSTINSQNFLHIISPSLYNKYKEDTFFLTDEFLSEFIWSPLDSDVFFYLNSKINTKINRRSMIVKKDFSLIVI